MQPPIHCGVCFVNIPAQDYIWKALLHHETHPEHPSASLKSLYKNRRSWIFFGHSMRYTAFELYWQTLFHQKPYLSSASQDIGWLLMSLANLCESTPSNPHHMHFDYLDLGFFGSCIDWRPQGGLFDGGQGREMGSNSAIPLKKTNQVYIVLNPLARWDEMFVTVLNICRIQTALWNCVSQEWCGWEVIFTFLGFRVLGLVPKGLATCGNPSPGRRWGCHPAIYKHNFV